MRNLLILFFLFIAYAAKAQIKSFYNWKGNALSLYASPSASSKVLISIPKGEIVQKVNEIKGLPAFNVVLSYYGSKGIPERGDVYGYGGTFYTMKGNWVKVNFQGKTGYVPELFLSHLADLQVHKVKSNEFGDLSADYMSALFGRPVSVHKKELPKASADEINYEKTYRYKNGNYLLVSISYFEKDGPGGEKYTYYLKGLKKHEAILLLLKLTSFNNFMADNVETIKKRVITNSLYDQFTWWYNNGDKQEQNTDLEFFYNQEGGSSMVTLKETKEGVIMSFGYGGC
ncbi:hypothetical protein HDF26_001253 [Pedobacter cryoconitis]|uniref:hypothetical protein n=1 Tax=Pedobacter cryoconitis TaxID=188932 RepID=UPI00161E7E5E|nr:hypothetical protein [Pedobacter cryoconitis]MBB6270826.1 hypothetical protein [Pedobacter cryoconitis]